MGSEHATLSSLTLCARQQNEASSLHISGFYFILKFTITLSSKTWFPDSLQMLRAHIPSSALANSPSALVSMSHQHGQGLALTVWPLVTWVLPSPLPPFLLMRTCIWIMMLTYYLMTLAKMSKEQVEENLGTFQTMDFKEARETAPDKKWDKEM